MYPRDLPVLAAPQAVDFSSPLIPQQYVHPGMSLHQLLSIIWAYRNQSLMIAAAVIFLVALACWVWPRTYDSTATLMVKFEVNDPLAGSEFPVGLLGSYMSTQVELARGSEVLLPVIDQLKLTEQKDYAAGYSGEPNGLRNWVEAKVRKNLVVEQGRYGSQLIYVTYSASDPAEAALIANEIARVYSEQQHQRLTGPANERAKRYTQQISELKSKVIKAQDEVTAYRQKSGLVDSDSKSNIDMQLLFTLEQRLLEAQNVYRAADARAAGDQSVGSQVLGSTMIQSLKIQLAQQDSRLAELQTTLGERHPQVLELRQLRGVTKRALSSELGAYYGNASSERSSSLQLEKKLQKAVEEQRAKVIGIRQMQDDGAKYQLELESAQSLYKRALDGYDQVMFASGGGYTNLNFISRAIPPSKASKPKVRTALLLACLIGGALGLGIPLIYELMHRRVRCRDDVERDHGIPVLAELRSFNSPGTQLAMGST